jgi:cell fate (sporulation/competence/biofilm development) regulator YlbF (YheA/YmcA/DUF963 family)
MKDLEKKIKNFSEIIKETKEFSSYQKSLKDYNDSKDSRSLWRDFESARQRWFIVKQGGFTDQDEDRRIFEDLLEKVRSDVKINNWLKDKKRAQDFLNEIAVFLSDDLGLDFNSYKKKSCCK